METQSIPWREKVQLIVRFLRGSIHYFVVALLCACLGMVFNALTPQVIRLTVDSILGAEEPSLPAFLQPLLPLLQAQKLHALWLAAAAVLLLALLRGFCNYGQRTQLSRGSESFVKRIRDGLYDHIQHLSFSWHTAHSDGRDHPALHLGRRRHPHVRVQPARRGRAHGLPHHFISRHHVPDERAAVVRGAGRSSRSSACRPVVFYRRISGRFQAADEAEGDLTDLCAGEPDRRARCARLRPRALRDRTASDEKNEQFASAVDPPRPPALRLLGLRRRCMTCLQVMVIIVCAASSRACTAR